MSLRPLARWDQRGSDAAARGTHALKEHDVLNLLIAEMLAEESPPTLLGKWSRHHASTTPTQTKQCSRMNRSQC
ncbi:hypothetical protein Y032_0017g3435 [Ancylostoma ceylanicum]|uniref:Uncharacterized protein n=1 Tax=Ancylostoma ceylanicum TaxID=53326 RepID=A0A016V7A4_9BILA|nr:hypothetical protein Y032_0017g3435 [Ancylostoma ceylanicum]